MKKVSRLPVQHPQAPHCPTCEAPLPNLDGLYVMMPVTPAVDVLALTLLVRCKCGEEWCLTKKMKA